MTHFNPITGEMQDEPWTLAGERGDQDHEHRAYGEQDCLWCQLLTPSPASDQGFVTYENVDAEPTEKHVLQFRGEPNGWLTAYCRNPECFTRIPVEPDRNVTYLAQLDAAHREGERNDED